MPLFTGLVGLAKGAKAIGGKIAARKGTTAAAKKATTTAKKAGATATLSPGGAGVIKDFFIGLPGKITGGLKHGARKVATFKQKGALKKGAAFGGGVAAGVGVGHHILPYPRSSYYQQRLRLIEEQRRQEQNEIRQDYRREEGGTGQMFADRATAKSIWKRFFPSFLFLLLILLFLLFLSERDRK